MPERSIPDSLGKLTGEIISCRKCKRLVAFREKVAREKTKRYVDEEYWGKPVPGHGDPKGRLLVIGLAPAAHGGNRTGRAFTGDLSAKFLVQCLYEAGFTNQPTSEYRDDGLKPIDCYIMAAVRCVPPDNKPSLLETRNCFPYMRREMDLLYNVKAVLLLGKFAFDAYKKYLMARKVALPKHLAFGHGSSFSIQNGVTIYASYHPSPRNTNTGTLTENLFMQLLVTIKNSLDVK